LYLNETLGPEHFVNGIFFNGETLGTLRKTGIVQQTIPCFTSFGPSGENSKNLRFFTPVSLNERVLKKIDN
jgi:hypothetical protein